jgi:alpha-D-ribose 1-methylphosphonate 5-triphosphate synthase subunit PhnI
MKGERKGSKGAQQALATLPAAHDAWTTARRAGTALPQLTLRQLDVLDVLKHTHTRQLSLTSCASRSMASLSSSLRRRSASSAAFLASSACRARGNVWWGGVELSSECVA